MFKILQKTLQIDITYSTNSFIFILQKLPIFKDLITNDIYKSKFLKGIIRIFVIIYLFIKSLFLKFFYYFIIFAISYRYFPDTVIKTYFHVYFFLTIIGLFINNKLLNITKKDYFSISLFNIDATKYFRTNLFWNQIKNIFLNSVCVLFYSYLINCPVIYSLILIFLPIFTRLIGEALNIKFYKKYNYIWYSNSKLYFGILIPLLLLACLPVINIYLPLRFIQLLTVIIFLISIYYLNYLLKLKDYKLIFKKLSELTRVMSSKNDKDYLKQAMVAVRDKDKYINAKKIIGKKGYDLFNTIFFERHREILLRSARKYSLIIIAVYLALSYLFIRNPEYKEHFSNFLNNRLGWYILIMYFINRGAIVTQAMFFNCDHAMLNYNFYREPRNLLKLFNKRLLTIIKVNLLPVTAIVIGNTLSLIQIASNNYSLYILPSLFILALSITFSVHYLAIYYLLQPFDKDMEVKKMSYSIATLIVYFLCYQGTALVIDFHVLTMYGIIACFIYILVAIILVYKFGPRTFKLN